MNRELEMAKLACHALDEKKGKDIKVIDIHEVSVIADYFVIASASNQNQVQAMVDNVDETLGRAGFEAKQIEGTRNSSFIRLPTGVISMKSPLRAPSFSMTEPMQSEGTSTTTRSTGSQRTPSISWYSTRGGDTWNS